MSPRLPVVDLTVFLPDGDQVITGKPFQLAVSVTGLMSAGAGEVSLSVRDRGGSLIYETLLSLIGAPSVPLRMLDVAKHRIMLTPRLAPGEYALTVGFHSSRGGHDREPVETTQRFSVIAPEAGIHFHGLVDLEAQAGQPAVTQLPADDALLRDFLAAIPARLEFGAPDNPMLLNGFFGVESSPSGPFRWTSASAAFLLKNAGDMLRLGWIGARPDVAAHHARVEVAVNGATAGVITVGQPQGEAELRLPRGAGADLVEIRLTQLDPWLPSELMPGNADHRVLGIALVSAELVDRIP